MKKKWIVILFFWLGTTSLFSQSESAKDTIPVIKDISIINEEILRSTNLLKKIDNQVSEVVVEKLKKESDKLYDTAYYYLDNYIKTQNGDNSLRTIEIKLSELKLMKVQAEQFLERVNLQVQIYGDNLKKLTVEGQKWNNTLNFLTKNETGELSSLTTSINNQLSVIEKSKQKLLKSYNIILRIQNKHSMLLLDLEQMIFQISQTLEKYKDDLFKLDSAPIWNIKFDLKKVKGQFVSDIKSLWVVTFAYLKNNRDLIGKYIFIYVFLFTLLFYTRKYYRKVLPNLESNKKISMSADSLNKLRIFNRPYSIALLISTMIIFYTEELPIEISELAILIMVFPVFLIFKERVERKFHKYIIITLAIFFIQTAGEIIFYTHDLTRVLNLFLGALLVILLLYINQIVLKKVNTKEFKYKKLLMFISSIMAFLIFISILSNIVGNVFLSDSILFSTMTSLFGAFAYSICFLTSSQIVILFANSYAGKASKSFVKSREKLGRQITNFLFFVFLIIWFDLVLTLFRVDDFVYSFLQQLMNFSIKLGGISIVPANLFILVLVIWGSYKFSKFLRAFLENDVLVHFSLPRGIPGTISMLTSYSVMIIGFFIAILAAGIQLDKLTIIIGGLGVGIGFGLQNIINNFISGLILAFERPIKKGDIIQLTDLLGTVKEIGIRSSTVRTIDGAEVIVPNGNLISNELINWTLSDKFRRLDLRIGVAYGTDPEKVLNILKKAMTGNEKIMENPEPQALFVGFGDSSLDFRLLVWTNDFDNWLSLQSEINVKINGELNKAGIEIPFPQRDLHIKSVSKDISLPPAKK